MLCINFLVSEILKPDSLSSSPRASRDLCPPPADACPLPLQRFLYRVLLHDRVDLASILHPAASPRSTQPVSAHASRTVFLHRLTSAPQTAFSLLLLALQATVGSSSPPPDCFSSLHAPVSSPREHQTPAVMLSPDPCWSHLQLLSSRFLGLRVVASWSLALSSPSGHCLHSEGTSWRQYRCMGVSAGWP
jgi:hypothetical protein